MTPAKSDPDVRDRIIRHAGSRFFADDFSGLTMEQLALELQISKKTLYKHFANKGVHVDVIKLYGSMELAPLAGLADVIVDLVSSGGTLRANDLVEVEEIAPISSRLIVNQASMKLKREALVPLVERIRQAVQP